MTEPDMATDTPDITTTGSSTVPISDVQPFPGNARIGDRPKLADSLKHHGQYRAVVVQKTTGHIIAGNNTFHAARDAGMSHIAVEYVDVGDEQAKQINLVDNNTNDVATYDQTALLDMLDSMTTLDGTGYTTDDLTEIRAELPPPPEELDPETNPDNDTTPTKTPADPVTKPGDIWILGTHRVVCGDSRDYDTVSTLLNGNPINIAFTSPPYASQRTYDPSSGFAPIAPDEYTDWFADVAANVRAHLADDGSWFVNIKEHTDDGQRHLYVKDLVTTHVRQWGWCFVDELIWNHGGTPGAFSGRFKNAFEPIFHFAQRRGPDLKHRPDAVTHASQHAFSYQGKTRSTGTGNTTGFHGSDVQRGDGMALPSNVLALPHSGKDMRGTEHEAAFPIALPTWFLRAYSDPGDTVYDPFAGAGTTLIAAHNEGRHAHCVEISPAYCDTICQRYQRHTGTLPLLESTGQAHDFTTSISE